MRLDQRFEVPPKTRERGRKITVWIRLVALFLLVVIILFSVAERFPEQYSWVPRVEPRYLLVVATTGFVLMLLGLLGTIVFDEGKPDLPKEP